MVATMNLAALTDKQLKIYLSNCKRLGETERARAAASLMFSRGIANGTDLKVFEWNQDTVRSTMQRFKQIASAVKGNKWTAYTEAGGFKIGRAKGDPDKKWIDTYCAIKTSAINAVFVCYVKRQGTSRSLSFAPMTLAWARTARVNSTALSRNGLRLPGEHRVRDEDVLDR